MKTLITRKHVQIRWPDDVETIKEILSQHGYTASDQDIQYAWGKFSESMCAGWLGVNYRKPNEVVEAILDHLEPVPQTQ